jgi:peptide chain release factor 2
MSVDINETISEIEKILKMMNTKLTIEEKSRKIAELESILSTNDIWNNAKEAGKIAKEKNDLEKIVNNYNNLLAEFNDIKDLIEIFKTDDDAIIDIEKNLELLYKKAHKESMMCMFSGEADGNNCFIEINSGAGGTEAQDWTEILANMYIKFIEKSGYKFEIVDRLNGEEAGIKNISIRVMNHSSNYAYGWLKFETGVHRLVRISPFDSNARRHTSFASVWVYPEVDDNIEIEINESDLRIDTYRASGAGGQHVNKTSSAVRITHIPTGIVAACQEDRSQHKNRAQAMKMLKSRLYKFELDKKKQAMDEKNSQKKDIEWGSQIRSYVLHPYQMVKDLRTNFERGDASNVLNGDLLDILERSLEVLCESS